MTSARETTSRTERPRLQLSIPPDPARLLRVRERIRDYLRQHLTDRTDVDDVVLAVEEAAANAIRHSGVREDVEIGLGFEGDRLVAVVRDHGRGFNVDAFDPSCVPDPLRTGGRGLYLISRLTDEVTLRRRKGLEVRMSKRVELSERTPARTGEEAWANEDERTRRLLEAVPEGFLAIDWEYRIVLANAEARRLLQTHEVEGAVVWELFPAIVNTSIERALRTAMEEGRGDRFEYCVEGADAWFEIRVHPTGGGVSAYFVDISARKRRERERETRARQQELLARIVDALPIPVAYVDAELIVRSVNETGGRLAARPRSEIVGCPAAELFVRNREPLAALKEVARSREPVERIMTWVLPDPPRRVDYFTILLPDLDERDELRGIFLQGMDASDLGAAQRELADSHARLSAITTGMTQGIISLDREHRLLFANQAALELMRLRLEDVLGRTVEDALPGLVGLPLYDCVMEVLAGRSRRDLLAGPSPTGRWYDARCFPTPEGVTLLFEDVTERRAADVERQRREEASRRARARATVLADIAAAAATGQSMEEVAQTALRGLALHLGLVAGNIHAVDEATATLRALALYGYDERTAAEIQTLPLDDTTTVGRLVGLGLPYVTHDTDQLTEASQERIERAGVADKRWIALTVGQDRIVAVLSLVFDGLQPFTGEELVFDRAIADQLGLALERGAVEAQRGLELSHLEAVMEASPVGLLYLDRDLKVVLVNSAHEQAWGHDRDRLVGSRLFDVYGDRLRPLFDEVLEKRERRAVTELLWRLTDQPERGPTYWDFTLTPVLDADGRVTGAVQASRDVTHHVRDLRMRTALQETAQALTETLEEEEVFVRLLGQSASALEAESAVVCLLEGERLVMRYVYGLSTAVVGTPLARRDSPVLWGALQSDRPIAVEKSDWDMPAFSGGRVLHARSLLVVPLRPEGVPSGVLVYSYHAAPRRFDDLELDFAAGVAGFASQALRNSRLYGGLRRARRFSEGLNEINLIVNSTMDVQTVLAQVMERAAASVGADGMRLMNARFKRWETVATWAAGSPPFLAKAAARAADRARTRGREVTLPLRDASRALRRDMERSGVGLLATVPLLQQGRVTGALLVGRISQTPFAPDELGFLTNVGAVLATAQQNARLFEQERHAARALQDSLLRPVPEIPGLTFASRMVTAFRPDLVGGDFSDAFELPGDRVGVMIGDVQGKGIEAAGLTETVRASLRALLRAGFSPAESLRHANGLLLDQQADQFVTLFLLTYGRGGGETAYATAGHPAPLLLRDAAVEAMVTAPGPPLGTFPWTYEESDLVLAPGDTLVLYTDGLSEARQGVRMFGECGVQRVLEGSAGGDPEAVVEALMREVLAFADAIRDDLHVLAVRLDQNGEGAADTGAGR